MPFRLAASGALPSGGRQWQRELLSLQVHLCADVSAASAYMLRACSCNPPTTPLYVAAQEGLRMPRGGTDVQLCAVAEAARA